MLRDYLNELPLVEAKRLILCEMSMSDVPDLQEWMSDPLLYRYWGKRAGKTDHDPALLFQNAKKPSKSFHWGIRLRENGRIIGELWIYLIENDRMAKAAYRIRELEKGNRYATEALQAAVDFCFTYTELQRLWADVDIRNIPSCRVLEHCGFTREGLIRQGKMVSTWCDHYLYGLLRQDWESKSAQHPQS